MENIRKIRVFISSRCGEKYAIARKALKELLLTTGLIGEVYVFEDEPASSEDTRSAYLDEVDESNLCIFLVDNRDGASDAVLAEQKRAKEKCLRLIYIFCDEQEKNPTNMQLEIKDTLSEKYYVVSSFSEIVTKAYESVVNDIATVYRKRPKRDYIDQTLNVPAPNDSKEPDITESYNFFGTTNYKNEGENIAFNKDFINYLPKTEGTMFSMIFKEELESLKSSKSNEHDESLSSFLKTILYYTKLNDIEYENLTKILFHHTPST